MHDLRPISFLLVLALVSCSTHKINLPPADSILIEPAGKRIDSPMQTTALITFIEGLGGAWKQPWHTSPGGGTTLIFQKGNETTSYVHVAGNWIGVRTGTSSEIRENTLSSADRTKLDTLLTGAK